MTPLLSVITINYNNASGLEKTIQSVLNQSFSNLEYIIIDGGSTDGSLDIIKKNQDSISHWVSEQDSGIYNAMNKGMQKASGKFITFLNSGDTYIHSTTLDQCSRALESKDADIFYGQIMVNYGTGDECVKYPDVLTLDYCRDHVINHQACFFKTATLKNLGGYNEAYKLAADYAYYLQAIVLDKSFAPILFPVVHYDLSGVSSTRMADYKIEMNKVWNDIIPLAIRLSINKYLHYQHSRVHGFAFKIHQMIRKIKNG
jgi:glycosyltransferase involved in cell wall biosynthesis